MFPQFLQPVADIDLGPLAQRLTFCQEQKQMASSTPVQLPGTLFHQTFMTLLIWVHSENDSRMYFLIVRTTDYCWRSWTSRITAPYKSRIIDWLIDFPSCRVSLPFGFYEIISLADRGTLCDQHCVIIWIGNGLQFNLYAVQTSCPSLYHTVCKVRRPHWPDMIDQEIFHFEVDWLSKA